jgi:predicted TIM-barrel fold metal-dependent hydrolase
MILDCHVHVSAFTQPHGSMSASLLSSLPFTIMRWHFGLKGSDAETEREVEDLLVKTIDSTPELDGAVVLAFDAVHDRDGNIDLPNTHLYVTNDYVIALRDRHPKIHFGASIHPYRKDAVAELERCIAAGAKLIKWLPITQKFNPADRLCIPFYEALAHHDIPLLSHTGYEHTLPTLDRTVADPMLLLEALRRGVRVIAAHCGTRMFPWEIDYHPNWIRLAKDHEHFYGDTAALNVPNRYYAYDAILKDPDLKSKIVHGSDWPIISIPPPMRLGPLAALDLLVESNWMRRDILIKQRLGFDEAYWHRAAVLLGISQTSDKTNAG